MSHKKEIIDFFHNSSETERKTWNKGDYICREGCEINHLNLIIAGRFRVFRTLSNAREMLYRIYLPGSIIGDMEIFTGSEAASCSVQCIEQAVTLSLPMNLIRETPAVAPELIFALGCGIARKLHENSVSEAVNTAYPLEIRLAHYYLSYTDPALKADSLGQLAGWMGCSYRHLTRSLASLRDRGAIEQFTEKTGKGASSVYRAADTDLLKKLAKPIISEERGRSFFEPGEK